jgi:hypothetical protein
MQAEPRLDYMLSDCFFAVGQAIGTRKEVDYDAIVWLRDRYRHKFCHAVTVLRNSWDDDRTRVMAVSRWLAHRAVDHAGEAGSIDPAIAAMAAAEIEAGCAMSARHNG